jgi:hypothetical protein
MKLQEFRKLIREEVRRVVKEAKTPASGQKLSDYDLFDKKYIRSIHRDDWFELLSDEPDLTPGNNKYITGIMNKWLTKHGYDWSIEKAVSQTEDGDYIWKIK